ncbi:helix-turn-helix transcriptional regulator [Brevibacterium spongiae]|uniref:Helix-turn-helix domain-containing protein n=1 Tax=Brevibacterium spongiae TaxID=2909672 RepID=A0ABY5SKM3_9MICO|nr:helix-turn-helix domain-containing protein [Brevibacterium spongiae]UVI35087.1 helix-turn-helix domain-containing protein [Brevibacterium spongiae]
MKNIRRHTDSDSAALGPEPAVPQTDLSPAVAFVHEHLAAQAGAVTISALAAMTGLHQNTVREHLDQLVETGAATKTKAASSGRGRPAWLYRANGSPRTGSSEYLGLASVLAAQIDRTRTDPRADGIAAGLDWGRDLAREVAETRTDTDESTPAEVVPAEETLALLDTLGFAPEAVPQTETDTDADTASRSFRLTRCPLLEAAHEYPDIVCGVHLGLVRGALDVFGDTDTESEIDPFSEPGACRLRLQSGGPAAADLESAPARTSPK